MLQKKTNDAVLFCVIIILISSSLYFFYLSSKYLLVTRIIALLFALIVSCVLFIYTSVGNYCWAHVKESFKEINLINWPSKKETLQTTLVISALVILMGIMLCLIDVMFFNFIKWAANFG